MVYSLYQVFISNLTMLLTPKKEKNTVETLKGNVQLDLLLRENEMMYSSYIRYLWK